MENKKENKKMKNKKTALLAMATLALCISLDSSCLVATQPGSLVDHEVGAIGKVTGFFNFKSRYKVTFKNNNTVYEVGEVS